MGHQAWFHLHSPSFSVHAFMVGQTDGSAWEQRIRRSVASFTVATLMSDVALAQAINKAAIDVLVTMNGWTAGHRMGVMALQPCPISIEWMGGHDTTGAHYITYIVSDRVASPPELAQSYYSEAVMVMPNSFFINEYRQSRAHVITDTPPPRSSLSLPVGPLLCNFNQLFKLDPRCVRMCICMYACVCMHACAIIHPPSPAPWPPGPVCCIVCLQRTCGCCSCPSALSHASSLLLPPGA